MTSQHESNIEVITFRNGEVLDIAEAEGPENARFAAQTLVREGAQHVMQGDKLTVGFYVEGKLVRMVNGTEV